MCPGVDVTRVLVFDNLALQERFAAQYPLLQRLCASTGFRPQNYAKDPDKQALDAQLTRRLRDLPGIRGVFRFGFVVSILSFICFAGIGWAFNGTSETIGMKMCTSGIVNFKAKDSGVCSCVLCVGELLLTLCFRRVLRFRRLRFTSS